MQDGDKVFVAYDCTMHMPNATHPDARFRNAELHDLPGRQAENYGTVVVFEDLYGNRWDLIQLKEKS